MLPSVKPSHQLLTIDDKIGTKHFSYSIVSTLQGKSDGDSYCAAVHFELLSSDLGVGHI